MEILLDTGPRPGRRTRSSGTMDRAVGHLVLTTIGLFSVSGLLTRLFFMISDQR